MKNYTCSYMNYIVDVLPPKKASILTKNIKKEHSCVCTHMRAHTTVGHPKQCHLIKWMYFSSTLEN